MAKPGSTHVIEIETGIGEPAFIPLTVGQELQPISVGKKGMWRIESARVLDVHAFVYFDGSSLFVQSADESQPASVDSYRVGKAWTELHAPCHIEIGAARLRFRSLSEPVAPPEPPRQEQRPPPSSKPSNAPPRSDPRGTAPEAGGNGPSRPPSYDGARQARPTGPMPQEQPVRAIPPGQYPPNFKQPPQMEEMAETLPPGGFAQHLPPQQQGGFQQPPPQSAFPQQPSYPPQQPQGGYPPPQGGYPQQGGYPPQSMGPGMGPPQQGMSGSVSVVPGSGPYNTSMNVMRDGTAVMGGAAFGSGAYSRGAPTVQTHERQQDGLGAYLAKYKELNPTKRLLVLLAPFCLIASAYLLLFDDDVPAPPPVAQTVDAGAKPVATNAQPQCPPGFVPYPFPVGGQIPCVPQGTVPAPTAPTASVAATTAPTQPTVATATRPAPTQPTAPQPSASAPPPVAMAKTLERQAVDAVAMNDYARAATIYEMLLQQNPNNRVYAEAARILHQKADAGAPPQLQ